MSLKIVIDREYYDDMKKTLDIAKYHPGDKIIMEFICYMKDRLNVTFIPSYDIYYTNGDVYPHVSSADYGGLAYLSQFNRTLTYTISIFEYNMLSYYQEAENHISLSGVFNVFRPNVWMIIIFFLVLFNFFAIANGLVSRVRRIFLGVSTNSPNKYETTMKILLSTYFLGCFILVEIFKANLSTKLTVDIDRNINHFDDLYKYPNVRIVIANDGDLQGFLQDKRNDVWAEYNKRYKKFSRRIGDNDDVFNEGNAIFLGTVDHLEYVCLHHYTARKGLHYGSDNFYSIANAFQVSKAASTTVKDVVNIRLMKFWETGHQIRSKYLLNRNACSKYLKTKQSLEFSETALGDVGAIFLVYISSITMSFLVMLGQLRHAIKNRDMEQRLRSLELRAYSTH